MRSVTLVTLLAAACGRVGFAPLAASSDAPGESGEAAACAAQELDGPLTWNFDAGLPAWSQVFQSAPASIDAFQGALRGRPALASGLHYAGISAPTADYRGRRYVIEIPQMVNVSGCAQALFQIVDTADSSNYVELTQACGNLGAARWTASGPTSLARTTYSSSAHRWWQLREAVGTVYFETSADGFSWATFTTTATPAYWNAAQLSLAVGTYQLESVAPGDALFDNLHDCGP